MYPSRRSVGYGEEDARRENGSGKEAIVEACGRKGPYREAGGRSSHHEDLSPRLEITHGR
jgi:predicted ATPase